MTLAQLFPEGAPPEAEPPNPVQVWPSPKNPMGVARVMLEELTEDDEVLIRRWRGQWMRYLGPHWSEAEELAVRKQIYARLEDAQYEEFNAKTGQFIKKPWNPNRSKVADVLEAMAAIVLLEQNVEAPSWLDTGAPATGVIPCANGLVDVNTQQLDAATPRYFGTVCVPFDYDPEAPEPVEWLKFLRTLWPPVPGESRTGYVDADEVLALQEWFGYVLSGRQNLQKMLLMVGPKRCGKGTIARVLTALVGAANVGAPTLASLATNFGLQPLLGRSLAIVGDARLQTQGQEAVVERLLSISGEDEITVDRKNREAWTGRIPARFMILSNELPRFGDASGAIASRFVILTFKESFLGREDIELGDRLAEELPGILRWALAGLVRLNRQRRITEPESSVESATALADLVSPISAFLREVCVTGPEETVQVAALYREYGEWCRENGRGVSSVQKLSSDLRTVIPTLSDYRPKVNGQTLPRHYRGLSISPEWTHRARNDEDLSVVGFMRGRGFGRTDG